MQRDGCVGQHLPTFRTGQAVKMKNINYYGQKITVSDEVAEFLEQDRLRESAQRRSDQRHLDFVGNEIYTMPGLFTDEPTDPTFEQAFLLLRKHKLRKIFPTLPDDDQKLLLSVLYIGTDRQGIWYKQNGDFKTAAENT